MHSDEIWHVSVDIQSVAAEIIGEEKKKIEDRKKPQGKNIMAPYYIGRP